MESRFMTDQTIDIREYPPAERHELAIDSFEGLPPGGVLTVVNDHDPSPLLHQLDATYDAFDAAATEVERRGRDEFHAHLRKRAESDASGETDLEAQITDALAGLTDPDLGVDLLEMDSIRFEATSFRGEDGPGDVRVALDAAGMSEEAVSTIEEEIVYRIRAETPVDDVAVRVNDGGSGGEVSAEEVMERLTDVQHPDRTTDIVDTGIVEDIEVEDRTVDVHVTDPSLKGDLDDYRGEFLEMIGQAAYNATGVAEVRIHAGDVVVPIEPPHEEDRPLADAPEAGGPPGADAPSPLQHGAQQANEAPPALELTDVESVVLVASAKGGVGKTTVATQLARGLADRDVDVGLLDADFTGPDVPQLLELEPQIAEGKVIDPVSVDSVDVMSVGLMENHPTAWNGEMVHNALFNLLEDVEWGVETLVVDLPPGASDTLMTFLQFVPIDGVVLITTPYPASIVDTEEGASLFREGDVPVLGVVANMTRFACPSCGDEHDLFPGEEIEAALEYPILAKLPFDPAVRSFEGDIPEPFQSLAETVEASVPTDRDVTVPDDAVDVRGMPEHGRYETVEDAFVAADPSETVTVVTERHPADIAVALVGVLDVDAPPSEVFEEYDVTALASDEWLLQVRKPAERARQ